MTDTPTSEAHEHVCEDETGRTRRAEIRLRQVRRGPSSLISARQVCWGTFIAIRHVLYRFQSWGSDLLERTLTFGRGREFEL